MRAGNITAMRCPATCRPSLLAQGKAAFCLSAVWGLLLGFDSVVSQDKTHLRLSVLVDVGGHAQALVSNAVIGKREIHIGAAILVLYPCKRAILQALADFGIIVQQLNTPVRGGGVALAVVVCRGAGCFFLIVRASRCTVDLDDGEAVHHSRDDVQLDFRVLRGVFGKPQAHTVMQGVILLDGSDTAADNKSLALYGFLHCPALAQIALAGVVTGFDGQIVVVNCLHGKILSSPLLAKQNLLNSLHFERVGLVGAGHALHINPDQAQFAQICALQQLGDCGDIAGAVYVLVHGVTPSRALAAVADLGGRLGALRQLGRCLWGLQGFCRGFFNCLHECRAIDAIHLAHAGITGCKQTAHCGRIAVELAHSFRQSVKYIPCPRKAFFPAVFFVQISTVPGAL
nr:MAG TPA: hypothetical protein [Caudoviricetes sp.]